MSLFNWTFSFFSDYSPQFTQIAIVFSVCDLVVATFFRIAFNGLLRFRLRYNVSGKGGKR